MNRFLNLNRMQRAQMLQLQRPRRQELHDEKLVMKELIVLLVREIS
jgi:hypothetical protein